MTSESARQDDAFGALSQFFVDDGTLGDTLLRVAQLACAAIKPADLAGLTMLADGKPATGVFTDQDAPDIDAAQYASGHGPCLEAFRTQQIYRIDDTAADQRWPEFSRAAASHGVTATLSAPVIARGEGIGALNFYSRTGPFGDEYVEEAERFARHSALVLSNAQVYWDARELAEGMRQAMRSRSTIDQAIGILMAEQRCTADEAFALLRTHSQNTNRKIRDLAATIIRGVSGAQPTAGPAFRR